MSDFPSEIYFLKAWNGREVLSSKVVVERCGEKFKISFYRLFIIKQRERVFSKSI